MVTCKRLLILFFKFCVTFYFLFMDHSFKGVRLLTSSSCPFDCEYCYIAKSESLKAKHEKILNFLKEGTFIEKIKSNVEPTQIKVLSFWGAEPGVTLDLLTDKLDLIVKEFPNLKRVSFTTSMMTPGTISRFIKAASANDLEVEITVSLDGPSFVVDKNRFEGASEKVPRNLFSVVSELGELQTPVLFKWKSTLTSENIARMCEQRRVDEYIDYFKKINERFLKISGEHTILAERSFFPTLALPGNYSKEDGKNFAFFLDMLHARGVKSHYYAPYYNFLSNLDSAFNKSRITCSGGDSDLALGYDRCYICHRSFFLDNDHYLKEMQNQEGQMGVARSNFIKNFFMPQIDSGFEKLRYKYSLRGIHDFWKVQRVFLSSLIRELADSGKIRSVFSKDKKLRELLAYFMISNLTCPIEGLIKGGSVYITSASIIKIMANGAFREISREVVKNINE